MCCAGDSGDTQRGLGLTSKSPQPQPGESDSESERSSQDVTELAAADPAPLDPHAAARRDENLLAALESRELIGQAQGILMERWRITADEAFEHLRVASQLSNRKLRDIAFDLVQTGEDPLSGYSDGDPPAR